MTPVQEAFIRERLKMWERMGMIIQEWQHHLRGTTWGVGNGWSDAWRAFACIGPYKVVCYVCVNKRRQVVAVCRRRNVTRPLSRVELIDGREVIHDYLADYVMFGKVIRGSYACASR